MVRRTALLFLLLSALLAQICQAQAIDAPSGKVILTITGAIDVDNSENNAPENSDEPKTAKFDLTMLEEIGLTKITTETPWTKGLIAFEGVLVRDLLSFVKAEGTSVRASALDNYSVDIPIKDFQSHDVILATRINGKVLRVRDNGPVWVIYPWTDNSILKRPHYFARSIWQLHSFTVNK